jgi:hypothetical protein
MLRMNASTRFLPPRRSRLERLRWQLLVVLVALLGKSVIALANHGGPSAARAVGASGKSPALRIAQAGWGNTDPRDLSVLLEAVAVELGSHFPGRELGNIRVIPGGFSPMVLFERGEDGEYVVQLAARDARWYQFVYQFAHELCHIHSNFDNKERVAGEVVSLNQWFEESVCEAAALYTLNRMAATWETAPPAAQWAAHAPTLRKYAEILRRAPHRHLPPNQTLANWFAERRQDLRANPYLRDQDEVVSNLLLALFEQDPGGWAAIGYLNADRADAAKSFQDYLEAWCLACPERHRHVVQRIMLMFGMLPPADPLVTAGATG